MARFVFLAITLLMWLSACSQSLGRYQDVNVGSLQGHLQVNRDKLQPSEPVHIRFTVTNTSTGGTGKPQVLESKSTPLMDIQVHTVGRELVRWSAQQPPDLLPQRIELAPGQSKTIELTWVPDGRVGYSSVDIVGILVWDKSGHTADATVSFPGRLDSGY